MFIALKKICTKINSSQCLGVIHRHPLFSPAIHELKANSGTDQRLIPTPQHRGEGMLTWNWGGQGQLWGLRYPHVPSAFCPLQPNIIIPSASPVLGAGTRGDSADQLLPLLPSHLASQDLTHQLPTGVQHGLRECLEPALPFPQPHFAPSLHTPQGADSASSP